MTHESTRIYTNEISGKEPGRHLWRLVAQRRAGAGSASRRRRLSATRRIGKRVKTLKKTLAEPVAPGELQNELAKLQQQVVTLDGSLRRWEAGSDYGLEDWGRLNDDIQSLEIRCRELTAAIAKTTGILFNSNQFMDIRERYGTVPREPPVKVPETVPDNEEEL